jgi:hypothetical protein
MQGIQKQPVSSGVFESVFLDADALGSLSGEDRAKLQRVVTDAVRQATRTLERLSKGASRYIMKERIDFPIDLGREPGSLASALAQAIVTRVEVRLGKRISGAGGPNVPSTESLSMGLAEPSHKAKQAQAAKAAPGPAAQQKPGAGTPAAKTPPPEASGDEAKGGDGAA